MADMSEPRTFTEEIDIEKASRELGIFSPGSLEEIEQFTNMKLRWFKERSLVIVSMLVIVTVLVACVCILGFSSEVSSRDWAKQTMAALMGFAAGGLWHTQKKSD